MGYELVREGELNTMYIAVKGILVWGDTKITRMRKGEHSQGNHGVRVSEGGGR